LGNKKNRIFIKKPGKKNHKDRPPTESGAISEKATNQIAL